MPPFKAPSRFICIESAQLSLATDEADYRLKLDTLERKLENAERANMKEGFFSQTIPMIDQKGNVVVILKTLAQNRVIVGPEIETPNPSAVILGGPPRQD